MIRIDFCCNDRGGDFIGRTCEVSLPNEALHLEAMCEPPPRFLEDFRGTRWPPCIWMFGARFPVTASHAWSGNRMWNAYCFEDGTAAQLIGAMHQSGRFEILVGEQALWDLWEQARLAPTELADELRRAMLDEMLTSWPSVAFASAEPRTAR